jgi:RNA polymerase sigma-70 factor (ECF subfamily)
MFVSSRPKFVATAYSILRNREDAEDAVQDAFLSGYLHLRSFEGRSALSTWFTRIVFNAALMMQRKRKLSRVQPFPESNDSQEVNWAENIPSTEPDPEMIHAGRETLQLLDGLLEELKPTLRQAFTMTCYDGLSMSEASAVLGVSGGAFKARVFRARRRVLDQTERVLLAPIRRTSVRRQHFLGK